MSLRAHPYIKHLGHQGPTFSDHLSQRITVTEWGFERTSGKLLVWTGDNIRKAPRSLFIHVCVHMNCFDNAAYLLHHTQTDDTFQVQFRGKKEFV